MIISQSEKYLNLIMLLFFLTGLIISYYTMADDHPKPLTPEMIQFVNSLPANTWEAGETNKFTTLEQAKRTLGARLKKVYPMFNEQTGLRYSFDEMNLPKEFDARNKWGKICPSVLEIHDQSTCGSCWAFGAASAITDRTCIASKGVFNGTLSVEDVLACCEDCGDGCEGGYPLKAWHYWVKHGLVSGGEYGAGAVCWPYSFPRCDHHVKGHYAPCGDIKPTPACRKHCQEGVNLDFVIDKHFGRDSYGIAAERMKYEIFHHGPIEGAFTVYPDFFNYKSGVYQPTGGEPVGGHAIKILGWGEDNGVPYWLIANSWNEDWGDKGFFKILRGKDCCGIESESVGGLSKFYQN